MEEVNGKTISAHEFLKALRIAREEMGESRFKQDGERHSDGSEKQLITSANQDETRQKIEVLVALVHPEGPSRRDEASPTKSTRKADIQKEKDLKRKAEEKQGALW